MRAIAVVVPAHDEEELLAACLDALVVAAAAVSVPVHVLVVLDACTDDSAAVCRRHGVPALSVEVRSAGRARALGLAVLVDQLGTDHVWLATTDADSRVAPDWFVQQLRCAAEGADAVFGVVDVEDWETWPPAVVARYDAHYGAVGTHPHRHGANLGIRADRYLEVGGMPELAVGEDQALSDLLDQVPGLVVHATRTVRVTTSSRPLSRVSGGFATLLASLR